jgi:hypothetical protein
MSRPQTGEVILIMVRGHGVERTRRFRKRLGPQGWSRLEPAVAGRGVRP